mmetsp:Transcript_3069/g.5879  ORF Transcript_3069/g.5879 Transcript_3069/m.5879 type:complete len:304 (-) Transcript_3069:201-1112(-)
MPAEQSRRSRRKKKLLDDSITHEDRQKTRKKIRDLHQRNREQRTELENIKNGLLIERFEEAEKLNEEEVHFPSEAMVELENQATLTEIADNGIKGRAQSVDITMDQFLNGLLDRFSDGEDSIDWTEVGKVGAEFLAAVPPTNFLSGQIKKDFVPRQQKQRSRQKKRKVDAPQTAPKEVQDADKEEKSHTEGRVHQLRKLMKRGAKEPVNLYRVIVNPDSFSQTVENLFDLSFLIKIGKVRIVMSDEEQGVPYVQYHDFTKLENADTIPKHQGIVKMDYKLYRACLEKYEIKDPFVRTRPMEQE